MGFYRTRHYSSAPLHIAFCCHSAYMMSKYDNAELYITTSSSIESHSTRGPNGIAGIQQTFSFPAGEEGWTCDTNFTVLLRSSPSTGHDVSLSLPQTHQRSTSEEYLQSPDPQDWVDALILTTSWVGSEQSPRHTYQACLREGVPFKEGRVKPTLTLEGSFSDDDTHDSGATSEWTLGFRTEGDMPPGLDLWCSKQPKLNVMQGSSGEEIRASFGSA